ncbi:keratin-associated protein 5-1-like isoform X1 [Clupea harengus]|uniref:Keratin-associated protein 5-1-like isoform X1 n=1 Tax=Clupea harengus TaxID=7950 RepID=A0A6P8G0H1_CLUHA|nr:keratin-associated protein 5-1-like isoform X1 [Clupea harengus]
MVWCKACGNSVGVCVDRCCDICCQGCVSCCGCLCPRDCLYTFCAMYYRLAHYCSVGQKPEPAYAMPGSLMGMVWCKALAPWSQNSGNGHEAPPSCTSCSMGVCVDRCCDICCQGCVGCFGCLCPRDCLYTFCAMIARLAHYCSVGQKPEPAYAMPGSQKCFSVGEEV